MSKKVIEPINVLKDGDMSLASLTSASSTVKYMDNVSYQVSWTGAPVGVIDVELSNDGSNWSPLNLAISTAGGSPQFIDVNQTGAAMVRLTYTRNAGTGVLNVVMTAKEI